MTRVKICGITSYEDARRALDLGAWALGFIFHRPSPRFVDPERAKEVLARLPADTLGMGVFVDRTREEVQSIVDAVGLRGAQLHGDEPPELVAAVRADLVVKAFRVGDAFSPAALERYDCDHVLLDTYRKGLPGGTGETFDWEVAREVASERSTILAGGIGPENIRAARDTVAPWALDVSSCIEAEPGRKDHGRMAALFDALR